VKKILLIAGMWAALLLPTRAAAQPLPNDIPDITANCPNTVVVGQTQSIAVPTILPCLGIHGTVNVTAHLSVVNLMVYPGGTLTCRPPAKISFQPVPPGDPELFGTSLISFGKFDCQGTPKTAWTRLTHELQPGQSVVTVAEAKGWRIGDEVALLDSREAPEEAWPAMGNRMPERFTLASGVGTMWTLSRGAGFEYPGMRNGAKALEGRFTAIGNLTRDVEIFSESPTVRGHVLFSGKADIDVRYVKFRDLGRTMLTPITPTHPRGKYMAHFHMMDPTTKPAFIGNALVGSSKWALTVHSSHNGTYTDLVILDSLGAGVMTEVGDERDNLFERILVMGVRGTHARADSTCSGDGAKGCDGTGIWMEGTLNRVRNNVVGNALVCYDIWGRTIDQRILEWDRNEAIGCRDGMQIWNVRGGSVNNQIVWHFTDNGLYSYPSDKITVNDLIVRGDPRVVHPVHYLSKAVWCGDYLCQDFKIVRPNIQGVRTGVHYQYGWSGGPGEPGGPWSATLLTQTVSDGFFDGNVYDLMWRQDNLAPQPLLPSMLSIARNNRHGPLSQWHAARHEGLTSHIDGSSTMQPGATVAFQVEDYQQDAASDFQVFSNETKPPTGTVVTPKVLDVTTPVSAPQAATIQITQTPRVVWHSWRGTILSTTPDYDGITPAKWDAINAVAVDDLGYTGMRVDMHAGVEGVAGNNYTIVNDNADPNVINAAGFNFSTYDVAMDIAARFRQRVVTTGQTPFIHLTYVNFGGPSIHQTPAEYAEFMLAVFQHHQARYGWVPDAVEVMLEPNDVSAWTPQSLTNAYVAARTRLSAAGFNPQFLYPANSNTGTTPGWIDQMNAIPGAMAATDEFTYHRYGGQNSDLDAIGQRQIQFGKRTGQNEYWGDFFTPNSGAGIYHFVGDYGRARNSTWTKGILADNYGCINQIVYVPSDGSAPRACDVAWLMRQYTKYVRPGAQCYDVTNTSPHEGAMACKNPDGRWAVIVAGTQTLGPFSVGGLPAGVYEQSFVHAGNFSTTKFPDVTIAAGGIIQASLPMNGAYTIVSKTGTPPPPDADGDKVPDSLDKCANTPAGATVDVNGCALTQLDSDGDKVNDAVDKCPGTPLGTTVDATGCPIVQPVTMTVAYAGITRDAVSNLTLAGDGINDPAFTLTFPVPTTVTRVRVLASVGGAWDTDPGVWIVCVAQSATGPCVNTATGAWTSTATTFTVFVSEGGAPRFPNGSTATITVTVGGINVVGTVKIGTVPQPKPVATATKVCSYSVTDVPPTTDTGWSVQFERRLGPTGTWVNHGPSDGSAVGGYSSAVDLAHGAWEFRSVWTRTGSSPVIGATVAATVGNCM